MKDNKYCYRGSDVLINKLGIHNERILHDAERDITVRRLLQLYERPIKGRFDYTHLKAIHYYIFQDIYEWAGKERTVNIAKSNMFCNVMFLETQTDEIFTKLHEDSLLQNLEKEDFINKLAYYFGEVNALHPFREGNGRTQREFFRELALQAGHEIDYSKISEEQMLQASMKSFVLDYSELKTLFMQAVIK